MHNKSIIFFICFFLTGAVGWVDADVVILKSGEMFQAQRAWKENGIVSYYQNGQVMRVDEGEVERLIQSPAPVEESPSPENQPAVGSASSSSGPSTGQMYPSPLPVGDDTGYPGLTWGQPLTQVEGLTPIGTDPAYGGVQLFNKRERNKRFGRAGVDDVVFGFWQGGLYTITVWASNFLDFRELKAEAFRRFGEGTQNREDVEKYHWIDQGVDRMLSYDYDSDTGYLWMRSRALHEKVEARYPID